jgi:hypothetical protein
MGRRGSERGGEVEAWGYVGRRAGNLQAQQRIHVFLCLCVSVRVPVFVRGYPFFDVSVSSQAAQAAKNTAPHKFSEPKKIDAVGAKGAPPPGKGAMVPSRIDP